MSIFVFDEKVNLVIIWGQETTIKSFIKICLFFFFLGIFKKIWIMKKNKRAHNAIMKELFFLTRAENFWEIFRTRGKFIRYYNYDKKTNENAMQLWKIFFLKRMEISQKFPSSKNGMFFGIYAFVLPWYKHPKHQNSGGKFEKN